MRLRLEGLRIPLPQKYANNSPKPMITAIKAIILHTFGVQVLYTPEIENHMERSMENDMESGFVQRFLGMV